MNEHERSAEIPETAAITKAAAELRSPEPLNTLQEMDLLIKPLPGYLGPGEWLKLLK